MAAYLVSGANGFVGRQLCADLAACEHSLVLAMRRLPDPDDPLLRLGKAVVVGDVDGMTDWSSALAGATAVVHLANRAHVMHEQTADSLAVYRKVNVEGTRRLAEQAATAGVRRLVYLSSVKVLGESTGIEPFGDRSPPSPRDPYAVSKWEAEQMLRAISASTGLQVTILRPPLVYGPRVGANFLRLMRWVAQGIPLPLAAVDNRRSMIYVGNLAACIGSCLGHPDAAGKTYLLSDGAAVSTADLVARLAEALKVPDRSWPLPPGLLCKMANFVGKGDTVRRLTESLEVDDCAIRRELNWTPPYSMDEGLRHTAEWFRSLR
jgi:nucleoside-diphosphate-sugar epimerase